MGLDPLSVIAVASVIGAGIQGVQAVGADKSQRKSLKQQKVGQQQAENAALKAEQTNQMALNQAKRKPPDIASLLAEVQGLRPPSTLLTGTTGLPTNNTLGT